MTQELEQKVESLRKQLAEAQEAIFSKEGRAKTMATIKYERELALEQRDDARRRVTRLWSALQPLIDIANAFESPDTLPRGYCTANDTESILVSGPEGALLRVVDCLAARQIAHEGDDRSTEHLQWLRQRGWRVAVHNDYRQNGTDFTFWIFTKGVLAAKGEGSTDTIALEQVCTKVRKLEAFADYAQKMAQALAP